MWGADQALKIFPNYSSLSGWLYCQPEETMLSPSQLWLDGWCICLNFSMDFADDFVVDDPLTFGYFLEGGFSANIFRFGSCARNFSFTEFGVLELSKDDCWFHLLRCAWFLLGSLEFSFLVNWLVSNLPCLLFLIFNLARSCRACFRFYSIFSCVFVSCGRRSVSFLFFFLADAFPFIFFLCTIFFVSSGRPSVSFLVLYRLIRFDDTWCRMFVCFWFK